MEPGTQAWLDQVDEAPIDPDRPIIDPHHHLWPPTDPVPYGVPDLIADTGSRHKIVGTVFVECGASYRDDGPEHLRAVGETEFVAGAAFAMQRENPEAAPILGIVADANLALGGLFAEQLDAHEEAAGGLLRGIRDALARAVEPEAMMIVGSAPEGLAADQAFRDGMRLLGARGLTYDTWHYHYQNREFLELARAVPDTTMVLDHFGTPVGVGRFAGARDEIFDAWKADITDLAQCENVVAKLGGLAMPDNGFGWHMAERPPTSDEFVDAQARYYHHTIEAFGPERCMFESNFPVDKFSLSYDVLWNGLKKVAARYTPDEQEAMFAGTARRVYRL